MTKHERGIHNANNMLKACDHSAGDLKSDIINAITDLLHLAMHLAMHHQYYIRPVLDRAIYHAVNEQIIYEVKTKIEMKKLGMFF
jgi:hypothetical protein